LLSVIALASAVDTAAKVTSLPNITETYPFASDWYSGYLKLSESALFSDKNLHYVFIESENNKATDPLMVWFNGGPGCSSMLALMQEHGPFVLDDDAFNFTRNPFPWTARANVIYLESPGGVGYSTAKDTEKIYNDFVQAEDAFKALQKWFELFPEYKTNKLFIAGESYGGIYAPYLSW